jgi:enamine deaminase RidA (YjgF/YER057c/UK114 family)
MDFQMPTSIGVTDRGFSIARALNGVAYLSGIVCMEAINNVHDFGFQFKSILATLDERLKSVKSDKTKLLSVTIHLASMRDYQDMNVIWMGWLAHNDPPARTTVEAKLIGNCLAEVTAITASDLR